MNNTNYQPTTFQDELSEVSEGVQLEWKKIDKERISKLKGTVVWSGRGYAGSRTGRVHSFDGLPKLIGIDFNNGEISYRSRFIRNRIYHYAVKKKSLPPLIQLSNTATGHAKWRIWNSLPYLSMLGKKARALTTGALDIQKIHDKIFVGYDGLSYAVEIDLETFDTTREFRPAKKIGLMRIPTGAAAYVRSKDGRFYNHAIANDIRRFGKHFTLCPFELMPDLKPKYFEKVKLSQLTSIHNITITDSYLIVILSPEKLNVGRLFKTGSVQEALEELPTKVGNELILYDRFSGKLIKRISMSQRFFFNHFIKSEEKGQKIQLDLIEIKELKNRLRLPATAEEKNHMMGVPVRYLVDIDSGAIERQVLWEGIDCEMPYRELPNEIYGIANYFEDSDQGQKLGVCSIYEKRYWFPENSWQVFNAPVVADGLVLVLVSRGDFSKQQLIALEASDFSVVGIADVPFRTALMGHGTWFDH